MVQKQKYYKVVSVEPTTHGKFKLVSGYASTVKYSTCKWTYQKYTPSRTPLFVFTDRQAALDYACDINEEVYECEVGKTFNKDDVLDDIRLYRKDSVFTDKVKLLKCIKEAKFYRIYRNTRPNNFDAFKNKSDTYLYVNGLLVNIKRRNERRHTYMCDTIAYICNSNNLEYIGPVTVSIKKKV